MPVTNLLALPQSINQLLDLAQQGYPLQKIGSPTN